MGMKVILKKCFHQNICNCTAEISLKVFLIIKTSEVKLYVLQNCLYQPGLYYEAGGQELSASNH